MTWKLLYADDLALDVKSFEELTGKLKNRKEGMESNRLRVNIGKTKVLLSNKHSAPVM